MQIGRALFERGKHWPEDGLLRDLNLELDARVNFPKDAPGAFFIFMTAVAACEGAFRVEVEAVGLFTLNDEAQADENTRRTLVNVNAPAIVFPYVRSFIATLTGNAGAPMPALHIPPHFFRGDLAEMRSQADDAPRLAE